jgi:hypothetical protein
MRFARPPTTELDHPSGLDHHGRDPEWNEIGK